MGVMVKFEMDLLVGIIFVMNMQMSSKHLVFPPNVTSSLILNCCLVPHHSIVVNTAFRLQN